MRNFSFRVSLNASPLQRAIGKMLVISALAAGVPLFAQLISADSLTPFEPRGVGTTTAKTVRIKLNHALAISSIAVAPGSTEFKAGAVSGCIVDGQTINPVFTVCEVPVSFTPMYPGLVTAQLVVTDGAGTKSSIGLAGTGLAEGVLLSGQLISADNLTPFEPRDVGTMSDAKIVRIKLNHALAISSIAVAPGSTEFTAGAVSGCVVDGHTINPVFTACSVDVSFSPQYPGVRTAPLVVTDGSGTKSSIGLVGTGLGPRAALTPGIVRTIAGNGTYGFSGDGGPATAAKMYEPYEAKFDWAGNLYITDSLNCRVRKIDRNGIITTVAGNGNCGFSGAGGPATSASLGYVYGLGLDAAGNIYISGRCFGRVLKLDLNGTLTVFAGTETLGFSGDGGPATQAELSCYLYGLAVDAAGNVYIADSGNGLIRKVDTQGIISTVAGGGSNYPGDGGPATQAKLTNPAGVGVDDAANLYIADWGGSRIHKVDTNGIITTVAGNGKPGFSGDGGQATQAELFQPDKVSVDAAGNIYISDSGNSRIRRVDTNGMITTIAGGGNLLGDGRPATQAGLLQPVGALIDSSGGLYVADSYHNRVRKVDVSQSALNFSGHVVGSVSPARRTIVTNTGNQHMDLGALNVTGDFSLLSGSDPSYCSSTPDIGPGFSCALPITFAPTAVGTRTGSATVTDNSLNVPGTQQTVSLNGGPPTVTLSASALDFGSLTLDIDCNCHDSAVRAVTVTNNGFTPLNFGVIAVTDSDREPSEFSLLNNHCGSQLLPGNSCSIELIFTNQVVCECTATLTINDNGGDSPQTVALTGNIQTH